MSDESGVNEEEGGHRTTLLREPFFQPQQYRGSAPTAMVCHFSPGMVFL